MYRRQSCYIINNPFTMSSLPFNVSPNNIQVTCEMKLFQDYFSLRRRPSEIILFQWVEICLKLLQDYFRDLLHLTNIFQHVHCR